MRQFRLLRFQVSLTAKLNQAGFQEGNGERYKAGVFFWDSGADLNLFEWVLYLCNLEYFQCQKNCLNFMLPFVLFLFVYFCCLPCILFLFTLYLLMSELLNWFLFWAWTIFTVCRLYAYCSKMCFHIVLFNMFFPALL